MAQVASASPETCSAGNLKTRLASADSNAATIDRPATTLRKKSSKASKNSTLAESSKLSKRTKLDSSKVSKKSEPSKTPKSKSKKPSSIATSSDRATAIEVLLRAATAAKAARLAAGEESEEEAPLPELPMPRTKLEIVLGEEGGKQPGERKRKRMKGFGMIFGFKKPKDFNASGPRLRYILSDPLYVK